MQYVTGGTNSVASFDIIVDGEFSSPDVGSVTYSLRDNAGALVGAQTNVVVTTVAGQNRINIPILATYNTLTLETETRAVILSCLIGGKAYSFVQGYTLTPWLPYVTTPADVRALIGLSVSELPDSAVDLIAAYYELANTATRAALDASLAAGGRQALVTNNGIAAQAGIFALPSLQLRVNLMEKSDADSFQRYKTIDWSTIAARLSDLVSQTLAAATGVPQEAPIFIFVTTNTDPVTGV